MATRIAWQLGISLDIIASTTALL